MKILVLGASGFLGGNVYARVKSMEDLGVLGTCFNSAENENLKKIDVTDEEAVKDMLQTFKPHSVIWCLMDKEDERRMTNLGLPNVIKNIPDVTKFIYVSTDAFLDGLGGYKEDCIMKEFNFDNPLSGYANAKIAGEEVVKRHQNHAIVRTGPLWGKSVRGNWDKRTASLIGALKGGDKTERAQNSYKTFVCVEDLAEALVELSMGDFRGIIHAGPASKESYYSFNRKMAGRVGFDEAKVKPNILDEGNAKSIGLPLDTSMDTTLCGKLLKTKFRSV